MQLRPPATILTPKITNCRAGSVETNLKHRVVAKVLCIHAQRLDREDELVVRIGDHTVLMLATIHHQSIMRELTKTC